MSSNSIKVLIVDDDSNFADRLAKFLSEFYDTRTAYTLEDGLKKSEEADLVLLDLKLREDSEDYEGFIFLEKVKSARPELPIIVITGHFEVDKAVKSLKMGAYDFLEKPPNLDKLVKVIENATENLRLRIQVKNLKERVEIDPYDLVGESEHIKEVKELIEHVARDGHITVLITGETGTGKELVARLIHRKGSRRHFPFVPVSLATIPENLLESELFGYEKGAFTDAKQTKRGLLEMAHRGVLFLDDIDYAPLPLQVKLLRFLEERQFQRIGGYRSCRVDVQVLASTNKDLRKLIREGVFREDLYFRISTINIHLKPLRERREDIPLLIEYYFHQFTKKKGLKIRGYTQDFMEYLIRYSWPGNVRELRNIIERVLLYSKIKKREVIDIDLLPSEIKNEVEKNEVENSEISFVMKDHINLDLEISKYEMDLIYTMMKKNNFNVSKAYKSLGLSSRYKLYYRLKRIGNRYPHLLKKYKELKRFAEHEPTNN